MTEATAEEGKGLPKVTLEDEVLLLLTQEEFETARECAKLLKAKRTAFARREVTKWFETVRRGTSTRIRSFFDELDGGKQKFMWTIKEDPDQVHKTFFKRKSERQGYADSEEGARQKLYEARMKMGIDAPLPGEPTFSVEEEQREVFELPVTLWDTGDDKKPKSTTVHVFAAFKTYDTVLGVRIKDIPEYVERTGEDKVYGVELEYDNPRVSDEMKERIFAHAAASLRRLIIPDIANLSTEKLFRYLKLVRFQVATSSGH